MLEGAISDDLVDIYVCRRACAALKHVQSELICEMSGRDLLAGPHDDIFLFGGQIAEFAIRDGRRFLHKG
jgi:hypothetical protein